MFAHLLAAVAFADRQDPDRLHLEPGMLGDVGKYQIDRHGRTLVTNIRALCTMT
jgi:hypothetical protein